MSAWMPLFVLLFIGLMGWILLRLIGGPGGPETFNPNSCSSCTSRQGAASGLRAEDRESGGRAGLQEFPVAARHHRLRLANDQ